MNERQHTTRYIKHLAESAYFKGGAFNKHHNDLIGNRFEMPNVSYTHPLCLMQMREEEQYTRQLYEDLIQEFSSEEFSIRIEGAGVHWCCIIEDKMSNKCAINCIDIKQSNIEYKGVQYCVSFGSVIEGRTIVKSDVISSIKEWFKYFDKSVLYQNYIFVDKVKRLIIEIQQSLLNSIPQLETSCSIELNDKFSEWTELIIYNANRHCKIYTYGVENIPFCIFYWDKTEIFKIQITDTLLLIKLVEKWLIDNEMPSKLQIDFPDIDFGKLAFYYENNNGIEGEFVISWDKIEQFYKGYEEIITFIKKLRQKGFDKTLRAGTSLFSLGFSRARRHGLNGKQACVYFSFGNLMNYYSEMKFYKERIEQVRSEDKKIKLTERYNQRLRDIQNNLYDIQIELFIDGNRESFTSQLSKINDIIEILKIIEKEPIN